MTRRVAGDVSFKNVLCTRFLVILASTISGAHTANAFGAQGRSGGAVELRDCPNCPPIVKIPRRLPGDVQLYVARHELTWREYVAAVRENNCPLPPLVKFVGSNRNLNLIEDDLPIAGVSPNEISCYIKWISSKTGKKYRLPTGDEWTYAARAGVTTRFPWGDSLEFGRAAISGHFADRYRVKINGEPRDRYYTIGLMPVESFAPNAWGLYDVVGNLAEYVAEQRPGPPICIRTKGPYWCQGQASRGGGTGIYSIRLGVGPRTADNPMNDSTYSFAGANLSIGYRLVRN